MGTVALVATTINAMPFGRVSGPFVISTSPVSGMKKTTGKKLSAIFYPIAKQECGGIFHSRTISAAEIRYLPSLFGFIQTNFVWPLIVMAINLFSDIIYPIINNYGLTGFFIKEYVTCVQIFKVKLLLKRFLQFFIVAVCPENSFLDNVRDIPIISRFQNFCKVRTIFWRNRLVVPSFSLALLPESMIVVTVKLQHNVRKDIDVAAAGTVSSTPLLSFEIDSSLEIGRNEKLHGPALSGAGPIASPRLGLGIIVPPFIVQTVVWSEHFAVFRQHQVSVFIVDEDGSIVGIVAQAFIVDDFFTTF